MRPLLPVFGWFRASLPTALDGRRRSTRFVRERARVQAGPQTVDMPEASPTR